MTNKYSVNDLSTLLNKHSNTIYRYLKKIPIEPIRDGNRNLYTEEHKKELERLILENEMDESKLAAGKKRVGQEPVVNQEMLESIIEKIVNRSEKGRIAELEKLLNEALEREKKLEQLLHQQQELHNKTLHKLQEKEPPKKELPYFVVDDTQFEDVDENPKKAWWERFKK